MKALSPAVQWFLLIALSAFLVGLLRVLQIPAALLLGAMVAGVTLGLLGSSLRIAQPVFIVCQAILGCVIAQSLSPAMLAPLLSHWPIVLLVLGLTLLASGFNGWLLVRYSGLPGVTGAWGASPGGASAMVSMAGDFGADVRLVAFMQYLRVLLVAAAAALVSHFGEQGGAVSQAAPSQWFPPFDKHIAATMLLALAGAWLGKRLRIPSGALLIPMLIGGILHSSALMMLQTPEWLLALAYTLIGWKVGLLFTRPIFQLALRALPYILLSISGLMLFCGGLGYLLTLILPIDGLTAYLATTPGGLDTIAIIAMGTRVDLAFVMAMQSLRLFTILLAGPAVARFISRRAVVSPG